MEMLSAKKLKNKKKDRSETIALVLTKEETKIPEEERIGEGLQEAGILDVETTKKLHQQKTRSWKIPYSL